MGSRRPSFNLLVAASPCLGSAPVADTDVGYGRLKVLLVASTDSERRTRSASEVEFPIMRHSPWETARRQCPRPKPDERPRLGKIPPGKAQQGSPRSPIDPNRGLPLPRSGARDGKSSSMRCAEKQLSAGFPLIGGNVYLGTTGRTNRRKSSTPQWIRISNLRFRRSVNPVVLGWI